MTVEELIAVLKTKPQGYEVVVNDEDFETHNHIEMRGVFVDYHCKKLIIHAAFLYQKVKPKIKSPKR